LTKIKIMEQPEITVKSFISAGLFLLTIVFGFILQKSGKPYSNALFTVHKLAAVGFAVYLTFFLVKFLRNTEISNLNFYLAGGMAAVFILLLVTGALLSLDKAVGFMKVLHKVGSGLLTIGLGVLFFRMLG